MCADIQSIHIRIRHRWDWIRKWSECVCCLEGKKRRRWDMSVWYETHLEKTIEIFDENISIGMASLNEQYWNIFQAFSSFPSTELSLLNNKHPVWSDLLSWHIEISLLIRAIGFFLSPCVFFFIMATKYSKNRAEQFTDLTTINYMHLHFF